MGIALQYTKQLITTESGVGVNVGRFVPIGEILTDDNFQDALEDTLAYCVTKNATLVAFPGAQASQIARYYAKVPNGLWKLVRTLVLPSVAQQNPQIMTVGISGDSMDGTGFIIDTSAFTMTNNAIISAGGDSGDQYTYGLILENFNIQISGAVSNQMNGIVMTLAYRPIIRNVHIMGLSDFGSNPAYGWGIKILDKGTAANNQYVTLENVWVTSCSGGVYAVDCLPLEINGLHLKQNLHYDAVFDACVVAWNGGACESGLAPLNSPLRNSKGLPRILTSWQTTVASGTGASIGTATGDSTTVADLSGMSAADLGRWLYLEKSTNAYDGTDKVSGYYLITEIVSATSVKIRKGSSHAATSSLVWRTCKSRDNDIRVRGFTYHESSVFALVGQYATTNGSGGVVLEDVVAANADFAVEAIGNSTLASPPVQINGARQMTAYLKGRYVTSAIALETSELGDIDEYTREGAVVRALDTGASGTTAFTTLSSPAFIRSSVMPAGGARTMCRLHGAAALWDARVDSSFNRAGADITSWTDIIGGSVANLLNAGKFPQYLASDPVFNNKPSVTLTGGTNANTAGLVATIAAARMGAYSAGMPCIVTVVATPLAAALGAGVTCRCSLISPAGQFLSVITLEGAATYAGGMFSTASDTQALAQTPNTAAHIFIHGGGGRSAPRISSEVGTRLMSNNAANNPDKLAWAPGDATLKFQDTFGSNTATYSTPFKAVFPFGLSYAAREQLLDQLALEFGVVR